MTLFKSGDRLRLSGSGADEDWTRAVANGLQSEEPLVVSGDSDTLDGHLVLIVGYAGTWPANLFVRV